MRLDVLKLPYTKVANLSEDLSFDPEVFVCHSPLISVKSCHAELKAQRFEEFIYVTLSIKAKVTLQCSYTLQNFETIIEGVDELHDGLYVNVAHDQRSTYALRVVLCGLAEVVDVTQGYHGLNIHG